MKKRFKALLLALILLLSMSFAACRSEVGQPGEDPSASTQGIAEATEQLLPTDPAESTSDPNMGEWA